MMLIWRSREPWWVLRHPWCPSRICSWPGLIFFIPTPTGIHFWRAHNNFQFHLYSTKSQQQLDGGRLYCKMNPNSLQLLLDFLGSKLKHAIKTCAWLQPVCTEATIKHWCTGLQGRLNMLLHQHQFITSLFILKLILRFHYLLLSH